MQYHVTKYIVDSVSWACTNPYRINLIATPFLFFPLSYNHYTIDVTKLLKMLDISL